MLLFTFVVRLFASPHSESNFAPIRPHETALLVNVSESNPGVALSWVKALDQVSDKGVLTRAVDGHQVGTLRQAIQLCISPGHVCSDVLVATPVVAVPVIWTGSTL